MIDATRERRESCPNKANHVIGPAGYAALQAWFREMNKTHHQRKCKGCGLWLLWEPREVSE